MPKEKNPVNVGDVFGRLTVVEKTKVKTFVKISPKGFVLHKASICKCICGKQKIHRDDHLKRGKISSCGCLAIENLIKKTKKHGLTRTAIYKSWCGIKERCNNVENENYGGRGIKYDAKWENFEGFFEDMGPTYKKGLSIDRIDSNGDYCKDNCRWADAQMQGANRRSCYVYLFNNVWHKLQEIKELTGLSRWQINNRYPRKKLYEE